MRWSALCVPLVLGWALIWAGTYHGPDVPAPPAGLTFVRHFIHFGLFKGYTSGCPINPVAFPLASDQLEPGDIIVCGNPGAVYGTWSHATIYLGNDRVLAQDVLSGIGTESVAQLSWYDHIRIIRPSAAARLRSAAAETAASYQGRVFNLMAHPQDPRQTNCSRCVADAYHAHGVRINDDRFWITPDALADASGTVVVAY